MFLIVFLVTVVILAGAFFVFIKTSTNPVAKFLYKKLTGKKIKKKKLDIVVMSGPSGVGKGTIIDKLRAEYPQGFAFSVSHTTRAPREGEDDGQHYHFVTKETFQQMIKDEKFVEFAEVHGNFYGTSKAALQAVSDSGRVAIVEIDVKGAKLFKSRISKTSMSVVYLFFKAPSLAELRKRIEGRGKEGFDKVEVRMKTAEEELQFIADNESLYDRVLENKDLNETYSRLKRILTLYGGVEK